MKPVDVSHLLSPELIAVAIEVGSNRGLQEEEAIKDFIKRTVVVLRDTIDWISAGNEEAFDGQLEGAIKDLPRFEEGLARYGPTSDAGQAVHHA